MIVRSETPLDHPAVRAVNVAAFETAAEADLVEALREQAAPLVSLVAEVDGEVVGHLLFTPVTLSGHPQQRLMGLAPMAVSPGRQRQGIGSALVRDGLVRCRDLGVEAIVVLGHPSFYPRFGFVPASRFAVTCEYEAPDDTWMLIELEPGSLHGASGTARYHPAFGAL